MINVTKGWPNSHGSEASFPVLVGQDVVEGDFVFLVDDGDGNPVWRLMLFTDTLADGINEVGGQALDTNTSFGYDVRYTGELPVVMNNYHAQTDRFSPDTYVPGDPLEIDPARPGSVRKAAGANIVARVLSHDAEAGILHIARR
jgi:hypothetical protein